VPSEASLLPELLPTLGCVCMVQFIRSGVSGSVSVIDSWFSVLHIPMLLFPGLGLVISGLVFAPVVNWYHSLVHWHPSLALMYHVYVVSSCRLLTLHVLLPLDSSFPLSLPTFGCVCMVQLMSSAASDSVR